jgi:prolyl-tRNA synthetase
LLRVREFVMKDAYSFGTEEQFKEIYQKMWDAYKAIFEELGLKVDVVAADNGYIGGEYCHEFVVESDQGESRYFIDESSGYAAHEDVATFKVDDKNLSEEMRDIQEVDAERGTTMDDGAKFHNMPLWQQVKDVLYFDEATKRYILAIIRGDFDVNETKLMQAAGAWDLRAATNEEICEDLHSEPGFISPINMVKKGTKSGYEVIVVGDKSLRTVRNMYGGANKKYRDMLNINIDRDYKPDIEADIALAQPGFISPDGGPLAERRGIEVGNIFQLGYHYSNLMHDAEYTGENGQRQKYYMGCYGIGIGRTMAAIVETHRDDKGILWPANVAPYKVYLVSIGEGEPVLQAADRLYEALTSAGVLVLYDDRTDARAGEKFADADLLGIPYRVVVSDKTLANQQFEIKKRGEAEATLLSEEQVIKMVSDEQNHSAIMDFRS